MKITRFSIDGFVPKRQTDYLDISQRIAGRYIAKNCEYGVYAFISGQERNMMLNHLSDEEKKIRFWWTADIDDDAMVYSSSPPSFQDWDIMQPVCTAKYDIFIPVTSLKTLTNIRRVEFLNESG